MWPMSTFGVYANQGCLTLLLILISGISLTRYVDHDLITIPNNSNMTGFAKRVFMDPMIQI